MLELGWWLLQPSTLLALLLVASLMTARAKWYRLSRFTLGLVVVIVLVVVLLPINEFLAAMLEGQTSPQVSLPESVDGVVVLGGALDWRVTEARGQLSFNASGERMLAAAALGQRYPQAELVFTGVFSDQLAQKFLGQADPQSLFFGEAFQERRPTFIGDSGSTYEDALRAIQVLQPREDETWILVTSALHMPRALATFETQGWQVIPFPVDYRTTGKIRFAPRIDVASALADLDFTVRELGAYWIYHYLGRIAN
jgi:uncharacterized SAM-binding protein YcdF (DUF218 family)